MAGRGGKHGMEAAAAAAAAAARDFDDERGFDFEPNKTRYPLLFLGEQELDVSRDCD